MTVRSGIGYDIHPLVDGRPLVLGGVAVPFDKGLSGHSDGDVLIHAVIDALLGGAGTIMSLARISLVPLRRLSGNRCAPDIALNQDS